MRSLCIVRLCLCLCACVGVCVGVCVCGRVCVCGLCVELRWSCFCAYPISVPTVETFLRDFVFVVEGPATETAVVVAVVVVVVVVVSVVEIGSVKHKTSLPALCVWLVRVCAAFFLCVRVCV